MIISGEMLHLVYCDIVSPNYVLKSVTVIAHGPSIINCV